MKNQLKRHRQGRLSFLAGGEGVPFLLLHGIPGSAFTWEAVGTLLADHFQVIIPDLLGFGKSELPKQDYYMDSQSEGIQQLLCDLGIQEFYLAGHDFGGPVAVTLMRQFPGLEVKGLLLSATNLFTDTYIPPPLRLARVPILNTLMFKSMTGNRVGLRMMYMAAVKNKSQASWEKFRRHLTPSSIDLTQKIFQRSLADLKKNYQAVEDMLTRVKVPALVLWGDSDPFFAASEGLRVSQAIASSEFKIYQSTGHFVPEERPNLVVRDIQRFFG